MGFSRDLLVFWAGGSFEGISEGDGVYLWRV